MSRILPYPLLTTALFIMWLLLQQSVSPGQILLGLVVALGASWATVPLQLEKPSIKRFGTIVRLVALVTIDIVRSNIAVARLILQGRNRPPASGFISVPLDLTDRYGLAALSFIVTATPGSAWLEYDANRNTVLIHVLDLGDGQIWIDTLKNRYETLLLEIFE